MKKHREKINRLLLTVACGLPTRTSLSGIIGHKVLASAKRSDFFLRPKQDLLRKILKTHWEIFLSIYQHNKKQQSFRYGEVSTGKKIFYLKKEKCCHYNYLILAKLVDLIGNTQRVQNRVRSLIKIQTKHLDLEKFFQLKFSKNSIFLSWISYLWIEQIYQFMKKTRSFLGQSKFISSMGPVWGKKNNLDIRKNGDFLSFKCQDFLLLQWYQNKIHAWSNQMLEKRNETQLDQNMTRISLHSHISSFSERVDKPISCLQNGTNIPHQKPMSLKSFEKKIHGLPQFTKRIKQGYVRLIKNILQKNKITTQGKLIQKLNKVIGNWDTFVLNNITKKKLIKFNFILSQLLWRWGLARHRKQKAKWIKKRYWSSCEGKPARLFFS